MTHRPETLEELFGCCPECGAPAERVFLFDMAFGICRAHKTKWGIHAKNPTDWRDVPDAEQLRNGRFLAECREVIPTYDGQPARSDDFSDLQSLLAEGQDLPVAGSTAKGGQ